MDADYLQRDIITTVSLIGNIHEALRCFRQVGAIARDGGHFGARHVAMETVRAEEENVADEHLMLADVDADRER